MEILNSNVKKLAALINQRTGIVYAHHNLYQLESRVESLMTEFKIDNLEFYSELFDRGNAKLIDRVLDLATNNETSFFRDPWVFEGLSALVLPELAKDRPHLDLKIWSAACSTGQEPYSIVMQLELERRKTSLFSGYHVSCTDISERVLSQAKSGIYSSLEMNRGSSESLKREFFTELPDHSWQVRSEFRKSLSFQSLNLLNTGNFSGEFDIVFCRNVLIYQTVENKIKIISELAKKIKKGGFLVLGGAESLFGLSDDFVSLEHNRAMFHQKR